MSSALGRFPVFRLRSGSAMAATGAYDPGRGRQMYLENLARELATQVLARI